MPKISKIKWRDNDIKLLTNRIRAFNAKRTRTINQNQAVKDYLPEKIDIKNIKNSIKTRRDFNNKINEINRFFRPGAIEPIKTEAGVLTTKYELNEVKIKYRRAEKIKANKRAAAAVSPKKGNVGTINDNLLKERKKDIQTVEKDDWKHFVKLIDRQGNYSYWNEADERYKANYIEAIKKNFGVYADVLISIIKTMNASDLVKMYYEFPVMQIKFTYSPLDMENKLYEILDKLNENDYTKDAFDKILNDSIADKNTVKSIQDLINIPSGAGLQEISRELNQLPIQGYRKTTILTIAELLMT